MSVIVATAYMEEAERFDWLIAMNAGGVLATGSPAELKARTGRRTTIEDAFVALLPRSNARRANALSQFRRARRTTTRRSSRRGT